MMAFVSTKPAFQHFRMRYFFMPRLTNHGSGRIDGQVEKESILYENAIICVFVKSTRSLLWEFKPGINGAYSVRNVDPKTEYFILAFDESQEYNAVIQDMVKPYDVLQ